MKPLKRREHERITKYSTLPGNRRKEWGQFNNKHEAIGVLDEEIFEMYEELKQFKERNMELHTAVYRDKDLKRALRNAEHRMAASLAEGIQVLAMIKKFRCLVDSEGEKNE